MSAMDIDKEAQEAFNQHHKSVVLILRKKNGDKLAGHGTGFIVGGRGTDRLVLTCNHFIRDKPKYEYVVRLPGEATEYKTHKLHQCSTADIAMFHVRGVTRECPRLQFRDPSKLPCQTTLFMLGYVIPHTPRASYTINALTLFPGVSPIKTSSPDRVNGPGGIKDIVCTGATKKGASGSLVMLGHDVVGMLYAGGFGVQICNVRSTETINNVMKCWLGLPLKDPVSTENLIESFLKKLGLQNEDKGAMLEGVEQQRIDEADGSNDEYVIID